MCYACVCCVVWGAEEEDGRAGCPVVLNWAAGMIGLVASGHGMLARCDALLAQGQSPGLGNMG